MVRNRGFHGGGCAKSLVNSGEVVIHVVKVYEMLKIFEFFGKGVGQSGESSHAHSHGEVLALDVASRNESRIGIAADLPFLAADAFCGVPSLICCSGLIIPRTTDRHVLFENCLIWFYR
jgi:hypothetical protein